MQNAIPGVFALLTTTRDIIIAERHRISGYTAWLIMPALAMFGLSFLSLGDFWKALFENIILIADILLTVWISAALLFLGLASYRKTPVSDEDLSRAIIRRFPTLLYLYAFTFFCTTFGLYLLLIPGVLAYLWLFFAPLLCLDSETPSFRTLLSQSKEMTRDRLTLLFSKILGGYTVLAIVYVLFSSILLSLGLTLAGIDPASLLSDSLTLQETLPRWVPLLLTTASLPFIPFFTLYRIALYEALKKA